MYIFIQRRFSERLFATLTIVALVLSAFPGTFLLAEAASTGVAVSDQTLVVQVGEKVNFVVSAKTDDGLITSGTVVSVSDDGGGSFYTGTIGGDCNSETPDTDNEFSISGNKGVCYSNNTAGVYELTVQLLVGAGGLSVGLPETIVVTVSGARVVSDPIGTLNTVNEPMDSPEDVVSICHFAEDNKIFDESIEVNLSTIVGAEHGDHVLDIIPPFWHQLDNQEPILYEGLNWDESGRDLYENNCGVPPQVIVEKCESGFTGDYPDCETESTVTVYADKIICTDEADLPNWGTGSSTITASTAVDWISSEHPSCELKSDWEFEWAPKDVTDPGDTKVGSAGPDWTVFTGSTEVPISFLSGGYFWVRELLQTDYIPFSHGPAGNKNTNDYSAELYCHSDVLNYDNYEQINKEEGVEDYYCVAWNVKDVCVNIDGAQTGLPEGYVFTEPGVCELEKPVTTYKIAGYKYEVKDDSETPLKDWKITARNTETQLESSTTTDESGYYYFELAPGVWEVSETLLTTGWEQHHVTQNDEIVSPTEGEAYCQFEVVSEDDNLQDQNTNQEEASVLSNSYECDFYNQRTETPVPEEPEDEDTASSRRSSGSATRVKSASSLPVPQVLGASTRQCGPLLFDYMKEGQENSRYEVIKLQYFLTGQGYFVSDSGVFDTLTDQAVRKFQAEHQIDVLTPWFESGYVSHNNPTGWVYQLTRWKINNIVCPGSESLPTLVP